MSIIGIIKNFSFAISSNLVSLLISTIVVLVVPKLIGVEEYGYWQLYLFYLGYVGFLHFGWNDGVYLRYGGKTYDELDKSLFFSQFYMLFLSQLFIALFVFAYSFFSIDLNKIYIIRTISVSLILVNIRYFILYILQATNQFKEFAIITLFDRILYITLIVAFILLGVREFELLILADIVGKSVSLIIATYYCKDIVYRRIAEFNINFNEAKTNILVGLNLMFAVIASKLMLGVVRFGIERFWDISTFGKISLVLSISNMLMLFVNTIGLVLFPVLRRTNSDKLSSIYTVLRDLLMVILLGLLIFYYPLKELLQYWLPRYSDSIHYMALLFPITIFEGKMALLINTYLKTLRKEKLIFRINIISLMLSILSTIVIILVFHNLTLLVTSIVMLVAFKAIFAEVLLTQLLKISIKMDILYELVLTSIFMLTAWKIDSFEIIYIYVFSYLIYLIIKRKKLKSSIDIIHLMLKK